MSGIVLQLTANPSFYPRCIVSYYEVWFSTDFGSFRKNVTNGELLGSENFTGNALSEPSPAGSAEVLTHLVQSTGESHWTGIMFHDIISVRLFLSTLCECAFVFIHCLISLYLNL